RAALVIFLIIASAVFRVLVGPGKRRGRIMMIGTLGGHLIRCARRLAVFTLARSGYVGCWRVARNGARVGRELAFRQSGSPRSSLTAPRAFFSARNPRVMIAVSLSGTVFQPCRTRTPGVAR